MTLLRSTDWKVNFPICPPVFSCLDCGKVTVGLKGNKNLQDTLHRPNQAE